MRYFGELPEKKLVLLASANYFALFIRLNNQSKIIVNPFSYTMIRTDGRKQNMKLYKGLLLF